MSCDWTLNYKQHRMERKLKLHRKCQFIHSYPSPFTSGAFTCVLIFSVLTTVQCEKQRSFSSTSTNILTCSSYCCRRCNFPEQWDSPSRWHRRRRFGFLHPPIPDVKVGIKIQYIYRQECEYEPQGLSSVSYPSNQSVTGCWLIFLAYFWGISSVDDAGVKWFVFKVLGSVRCHLSTHLISFFFFFFN